MQLSTKNPVSIPYTVPRHPAPVDLRLDGNEGAPCDADLLASLSGLDAEALRAYPDASPLEARLARAWSVSADRVLVTAGADDALLRICLALLGPGRDLVLPVPTFEMIERYARTSRGGVVSVPWLEDTFPIEQVLAAVDENTAAVAVVSPNNPTGTVAGVADLERLVAETGDAVVVLDQAYAEFADEDLTAPALELPRTIVVRSFSKAKGLAGLRVGYALGPPGWIQRLRAVGNPYPVSAPSLALVGALVARGAVRALADAGRVRRERDAIARALSSAGAVCTASHANFLLVRLERSAWLRDALAGLGIGVRVFPGRRWLEDAVRITCPQNDDACDRLIEAIRTALTPEALLFDMDGVLADVRRSYRTAVRGTAESYGVTIDDGDIDRAKAAGNANDDWALTRRLLIERGVVCSQAEVTNRFESLYQGTADYPGLRSQESLIPDVGRLRSLAARVPLGVVTGRPRADALRFLREQGIEALFSVVVCREDAPLKPAPDPVRLALERLGVTRAWLFGDTPDDIVAARCAGVVPIGVSPEASGRSLLEAGAARVVARPDEIEELLS